MDKWYSNTELNNEVIISSRVRLARNLTQFSFNTFLDEESSNELIEKIKNTIINERTHLFEIFDFTKINDLKELDKLSMLENNLLSYELVSKKLPTAVLLKKDYSVSIMINEEDHIRIQSIFSGYNIDKAFEEANRIDDIIEETCEYAFDDDYGYLTSCITNVGTGMRASFMIHIPMLEKYGHFDKIVKEISKFGITIRGIYGEGSKSLGGIYQISNQLTIGKTEQEIIENLKNITIQIVEKEISLRNRMISKNKMKFLDKVYRSYGILANCKKISLSEAIDHLSNIWLGITTKIFEEENLLNLSIYNIIINCQPANLTKTSQDIDDIDKLNIHRAKYLNKILK